MKPTIKNKALKRILENGKNVKMSSDIQENGLTIIGGYVYSLLEITEWPEVNLPLDLTYGTVKNLPAAIGWEFSAGQNPGSGYSTERNIAIAEKTIAAYLDCLAMNEENASIVIKVTKERTSTDMGELTATCVRGIASVDFLGEIADCVSYLDKNLIVNMDKAVDAYRTLTGKDLTQYGVDGLIVEIT